jgi:uncharacterized protein
MSSQPGLRRTDKQMADDAAYEFLRHGFCGRLGTVGPDGYPYVVPLLYVYADGRIYVHNTRARGHLRENVDHNPRVCFEVDAPGEVFPYGRFECDTSVSYRSVVAFGTISVKEDREEKARFCTELMRKYADPAWDRPQEFYPRLDQITVYVIEVERLTGKETPLPEVCDQWPITDRTRTPNAAAP